MQLGKKKPLQPAVDFSAMGSHQIPNAGQDVAAVPQQGSPPQHPDQRQSGGSASPFEEPAQKLNPLKEPVSVAIEETFEASLGAEGGLNNEFTLQGKFEVTVYDDSKADLVCFRLPGGDGGRFKYRLHPNLNKQSHADSHVLEMRDASKK